MAKKKKHHAASPNRSTEIINYGLSCQDSDQYKLEEAKKGGCQIDGGLGIVIPLADAGIRGF